MLLAGLADEGLQDQTVYDFLFDRLRAVRQDLTLQTVADPVTLTVLASCVRFHLVFGLLLRSSQTFSQHLNSQHQLDCLKSCLLLTPDAHQVEELTSIHCVYLLNNMDSDHALVWALNNKHTSQLLGIVWISQGFRIYGIDFAHNQYIALWGAERAVIDTNNGYRGSE